MLAIYQKKRKKEPIKVYPDGREVCDLSTTVGRVTYNCRLMAMIIEQNFGCAICGLNLQLEFDHAAGRGAAGKHRDDRTHDVHGNRINAAVCHFCNAMKGSIRYSWQGNQYLPISKENSIGR